MKKSIRMYICHCDYKTDIHLNISIKFHKYNKLSVKRITWNLEILLLKCEIIINNYSDYNINYTTQLRIIRVSSMCEYTYT